MSSHAELQPWQKPHPCDARRLIAQVCRQKIHPALQGYFWRRYIIMQNVTKQDGKYSEIGWDDFVYLCANPPEAPDAPGGTLVTVTPRHINDCIRDWWHEIWGTTEKIDQFVGELIELLKVPELQEVYAAACAQWKQIIVDEFEINLGGTPYMPSEKHGLFVEACFGHSSQILELVKSGLMELQKYWRESLPTPRGSFRQSSIFAPLGGNPPDFEGPLHTFNNGYLPRLKNWFAAQPDDRAGSLDRDGKPMVGDGGNNTIYESRVATIMCEDFCNVLTRAGVFDFKNNIEFQKAVAQTAFHQCKNLTYEDVAGTNPQDRQMTSRTWDGIASASIEQAAQRVLIGKIEVPERVVVPHPYTQGEGDLPVDLASGGGSGPGPSKKRKREKSVTFDGPDHPKDVKKEESTWIWALGAIGAAFLILRR